MIGKGARLPEVVDAMKKYDGVYFGAIGGAGALLAKCIKKQSLSLTKTSEQKHSASFMWKTCRL